VALPPKVARAAKAPHASVDLRQQRSAQWRVLLLLRAVHNSDADTSGYMTVLDDVVLAHEVFADIDLQQTRQLLQIARALPSIVAQRAVPAAVMQRALTAEQHVAYMDSYDTDISHVESEDEIPMPTVLVDYMSTVKQGDKYERMANMHSRSKKRDYQGKTAAMRYRDMAEGCYESALMDLLAVLDTDPKTNPKSNTQLAAEVQYWLDRDVDASMHGNAPYPCMQQMPRVRGSGGKYVLIAAERISGQRQRRYWRQREALCAAALTLIYGDPENLHTAHVDEWHSARARQASSKLQQILRNVYGDDDEY
jgi:hypothetical protein